MATASKGVDAKELLSTATKTSWRVPGFGKSGKSASEPVPVPDIPTLEVSREPALQTGSTLSAPKSQEPEVFKRPQKSPWGWIVLAFLLSLAAFGMMYQDLVMQEVEAFKKYLLRGTPAAVQSEQDLALASAAASEAAASAVASAPVESASVAPALQPAPAPAAAAAVVASTPALAPASVSTAGTDSAKLAAVPVVEPPKVVEKPKAKPVDANNEDAWLDQLPANGFVVQLAAFDTQADALAFQRGNAVFAKARIVRAPKKGSDTRYFIVLSRAFENKAQADAYMQSNPLLAKGWLRSVKSLKSQFNKP